MITASEAIEKEKNVIAKEKEEIEEKIDNYIETAIKNHERNCCCYLDSYSDESIKYFVAVLKENGYRNVKNNSYFDAFEMTKYISFEW